MIFLPPASFSLLYILTTFKDIVSYLSKIQFLLSPNGQPTFPICLSLRDFPGYIPVFLKARLLLGQTGSFLLPYFICSHNSCMAPQITQDEILNYFSWNTRSSRIWSLFSLSVSTSFFLYFPSGRYTLAMVYYFLSNTTANIICFLTLSCTYTIRPTRHALHLFL